MRLAETGSQIFDFGPKKAASPTLLQTAIIKDA
jgi:hypothetical protein